MIHSRLSRAGGVKKWIKIMPDDPINSF